MEEMSGTQYLRLRQTHYNRKGPPVPRKFDTAAPSTKHAPTTGRQPQHKPLPLPPFQDQICSDTINRSILKPLPPPPNHFALGQTLLWVAGIATWFLLIVLLLPIVTEKDAVPSLNRWLRNFGHALW
ncbi:hypothetical protein ACN47E_004862 [Coniothyrium glycines]